VNKVELTKEFWKSVTVKSMVNLTDTAALEASQAEGRGMQGMDFVVEEILSIKESNKLCEWLVFKIVNPKQVLFLVVKIVGEAVDLRMYYNPESIVIGDRKDQINAQNVFMFENFKPHSHNNLLSLKYAKKIDWTFDFGKGPVEIPFTQKGNMEFSGEAVYTPNYFANEKLIATVSEYLADLEATEPEMMIIEVGNVKNKNGGSILFLVGNQVNQFEISIVRK